jgi:phosphate starvation-inducible protein PhoH
LKEQPDQTVEKVIFDDLQMANALFGAHSENLRRIARTIGVKINAKGNVLKIKGRPGCTSFHPRSE